jgi:hypothetical protein
VCRQSALNKQAAFFRQTIMFSSFVSPEINALVASWCNHSGRITISSQPKGTLSHVWLEVWAPKTSALVCRETFGREHV